MKAARKQERNCNGDDREVRRVRAPRCYSLLHCKYVPRLWTWETKILCSLLGGGGEGGGWTKSKLDML